jgi:hypothetical protein
MDQFKISLANGEESQTPNFYTDVNGVMWPIYVKRLAIAAMANAAGQDIAHGVPTIKLNGHFKCRSLEASNAGNTLRVGLQDIRVTSVVLKDVTHVTVVNTGDLTLYVNGSMVIEYCKTTDNA